MLGVELGERGERGGSSHLIVDLWSVIMDPKITKK